MAVEKALTMNFFLSTILGSASLSPQAETRVASNMRDC